MKCQAMTQHTTRYEVRVLLGDDLTPYIMRHVLEFAEDLHQKYSEFGFNWKEFPFKKFADHDRGLFLMCFENGKPVGMMMASYSTAFFDSSIKTLTQQTLYSKPGSRASKLLLETFIDIGRKSADRIFTCIGKQTNIKPSSLERMGFVEMDTLYRMEI